MLTAEDIRSFKDNGFIVVNNILSEVEVYEARNQLHNTIKLVSGIEHGSYEWYQSAGKIGPRLKNPGNNILYAKWKLLDIHLHSNVTKAYEELFSSIKNDQNFQYPYEAFDSFYCYIDRVCYRLPDCIYQEGGLGLHIDRNPLDPFLELSSGLEKWRPIQGFVTLTDHYDNDSGGLKVVSGFHKICDTYFKDNDRALAALGTKGEFFRMGSKSFAQLEHRLEHVYAPKGSLVMWDNRLPHCTSSILSGSDSREVVYCSFLPDVAVNRCYIENQRRAIIDNVHPNTYSNYTTNHRNNDKTINSTQKSRHSSSKQSEVNDTLLSTVDRDWEIDELSIEQKRLLGIN